MLKRTSILLIMTLCGQISLLAVENIGLLKSNGSVMVNGKSVAGSQALFSGDAVETGANASAIFTAEGCVVQIAPSSKMTLGAEQFQVDSGSFGFQTTSAKSLVAGEFTLAPLAEEARFELNFRGKELWISAINNPLLLRAGTLEQLVIPRGKTAIVRDTNDARAGVRVATEAAAKSAKPRLGPKAVIGTTILTAAVMPLAVGRTRASEWQP